VVGRAPGAVKRRAQNGDLLGEVMQSSTSG
jgi:hypothetical protein